MEKEEKVKLKLWQSMVNTDLSPDEFIDLQTLGKIREQSLRQLVSNILRQEMRAFNDLIQKKREVDILQSPLEAGASKKRQRGRPRLKDAQTYTKVAKDKKLPTSMLTIIEEKLKD
jgi:hypothetical protein